LAVVATIPALARQSDRSARHQAVGGGWIGDLGVELGLFGLGWQMTVTACEAGAVLARVVPR
jgi:hypothetical protein